MDAPHLSTFRNVQPATLDKEVWLILAPLFSNQNIRLALT